MKGVHDISESEKLCDKNGKELFINVHNGYICDRCGVFFRGQSKARIGDKNICLNCGVELKLIIPKKSARDIFFENYKSKGLSDVEIEILWKNERKGNNMNEFQRKVLTKTNTLVKEKGMTRTDAYRQAYTEFKSQQKEHT